MKTFEKLFEQIENNIHELNISKEQLYTLFDEAKEKTIEELQNDTEVNWKNINDVYDAEYDFNQAIDLIYRRFSNLWTAIEIAHKRPF